MSKDGQKYGQHWCKHASGHRKFNKREASKRRRRDMSSYEFDAESLEEIDFWKGETEFFENELEIAQAECFDAHMQIDELFQKNIRLQDLLLNIIYLNEMEADQDKIDSALESAKLYIEQGRKE